MTPIQLTGGDPGTPKEAAYRILLLLGCTNESGGVFGDDLETITTIIADLVAAEADAAKDDVCSDILSIMHTYHEQDAEGSIGTPGGLEHMGDVWRLFSAWERQLKGEV